MFLRNLLKKNDQSIPQLLKPMTKEQIAKCIQNMQPGGELLTVNEDLTPVAFISVSMEETGYEYFEPVTKMMQFPDWSEPEQVVNSAVKKGSELKSKQEAVDFLSQRNGILYEMSLNNWVKEVNRQKLKSWVFPDGRILKPGDRIVLKKWRDEVRHIDYEGRAGTIEYRFWYSTPVLVFDEKPKQCRICDEKGELICTVSPVASCIDLYPYTDWTKI